MTDEPKDPKDFAPPALLEPTTFAEAMAFAKMLAKSEFVPKDYRNKPENILVAIQWGREVGLSPIQALNNISVINGKPAIWGDSMLALCQASPKCDYINESLEGEGDNMVAHCHAKRRNEPEEKYAKFSVSDAKKAKLWSKAGAWQDYPKRMLQMRARGFALRDAFADVLKGVISIEEARDYPVKKIEHRKPTPKPNDPPHDEVKYFKQGEEIGSIKKVEIDPETGEIKDALDEIFEAVPPQQENWATRMIRAMRDCKDAAAYHEVRQAYAKEYAAGSQPDRERVKSEHYRMMNEGFGLNTNGNNEL